MSTKITNRHFKFYADSGHGWLAVKAKIIVELGLTNEISTYSYIRGGTVYLEEDCDAMKIIKALGNRGERTSSTDKYVGERSPIRSYDYYTPARCVSAATK